MIKIAIILKFHIKEIEEKLNLATRTDSYCCCADQIVYVRIWPARTVIKLKIKHGKNEKEKT